MYIVIAYKTLVVPDTGKFKIRLMYLYLLEIYCKGKNNAIKIEGINSTNLALVSRLRKTLKSQSGVVLRSKK